MKKVAIYGSIFLFVFLLGVFGVYRFVLPKLVVVDSVYAGVTTESLMVDSDLILLGEVVDISKTRWNQDNGRFWEDGWPYYNITLSVIEPIIGEVKAEVVLTVLETSPLDGLSQTSIESDQPSQVRERPLQVGDKAVFFAYQTEIAWRNPERVPAIVFMGYPQGATFLEETDGLYYSIDGESFSFNELVAEIAQKRATQP